MAPTQRLESQLQLTMQGGSIITIPTGVTPIVASADYREITTDDAALIINLLRCGCPSVQIIPPSSGSDDNWQKFKESIEELLRAYALEGERFETRVRNEVLFFATVIRHTTAAKKKGTSKKNRA
jgi:hypothetical protein